MRAAEFAGELRDFHHVANVGIAGLKKSDPKLTISDSESQSMFAVIKTFGAALWV